jgi:hypothetical protein
MAKGYRRIGWRRRVDTEGREISIDRVVQLKGAPLTELHDADGGE